MKYIRQTQIFLEIFKAYCQRVVGRKSGEKASAHFLAYCYIYKFTVLPVKSQTEPFFLPACYEVLELRQGVGTCKCFHGQLL